MICQVDIVNLTPLIYLFQCLNCNASVPSLTSCCPARDPNEECCPSLGDCMPEDQDEEVCSNFKFQLNMIFLRIAVQQG